jgi:hypothetical protein
MIDVKIRRNNLHFKMERFDKLKTSLIHPGSSITFDEEELNMMHCLVLTLESVKLVVEALCRHDATLLSADTTIFLYDQQFGQQWLRRLVEGIVFNSLQYLHSNATNIMLN